MKKTWCTGVYLALAEAPRCAEEDQAWYDAEPKLLLSRLHCTLAWQHHQYHHHHRHHRHHDQWSVIIESSWIDFASSSATDSSFQFPIGKRLLETQQSDDMAGFTHTPAYLNTTATMMVMMMAVREVKSNYEDNDGYFRVTKIWYWWWWLRWIKLFSMKIQF